MQNSDIRVTGGNTRVDLAQLKVLETRKLALWQKGMIQTPNSEARSLQQQPKPCYTSTPNASTHRHKRRRRRRCRRRRRQSGDRDRETETETDKETCEHVLVFARICTLIVVLDSTGGGAWALLAGGVNCLVDAVIEGDPNLRNSYT